MIQEIAQQLRDIANKLENIDPQEPFWNIAAKQKGDSSIEVTWDTHVTDNIDIEFFQPGRHTEWRDSVLKYLPNEEIPGQLKAYTIGLKHGSTGEIMHGEWRFRIKYKDYRSPGVAATLGK